jgi:cyclopropane fatty-acyl-phospholipid synthase-like methyltransferase
MSNANYPNVPEETVEERTQRIAQRWVNTPYYGMFEHKSRAQWEGLILPFLAGFPIDMTRVLELACGHGRMTQFLIEQALEVVALDILQENIDFCAQRFRSARNLRLVRNDGVRLTGVPDKTISFGFCFDSMVHFDSDVVRSYLAEFRRVLEPGGTVVLHHSNLTRNPGGDFQRAAHARNFMSVELFRHYAIKEGLIVVKQSVIDWGEDVKQVKNLDGLTLLRKD